MNSPLILLLPLALILAPMLYLVLRDSKRAQTRMSELEAPGFSPDLVFDMSDMKVVLDMKVRCIAFVNVELQVFSGRRESSYMSRLTIREPFSNLDRLDVHLSTNLISITVHFNGANTFNSSKRMSFATAPQSKRAVVSLVDAWPGTGRAGFVDTLVGGG